MSLFWNDIKYAFRQLRQRPAFSAVVILILALGIGATTAIFSVLEAFLLRPLPYPDSGQLVSVHCEMPGTGRMNIGMSVPEFEDLRDNSGIFEELSMIFPMHGNLTGVDRPRRVEAMAVSPSYFRLLGASAMLGRTFGEEEQKVKTWAEGCVLSYGAWKRCFGGDPEVLEHKFWMDYDTYRVIGVMPPGFRHPGRTLTSDVDVWFTGGMRVAPFGAEPNRNRRIIPGIIGRLRADVTLAQAQSRTQGFAETTRRQFPDAYPSDCGWTPCLEPLQQYLVGNIQAVLWLLFAAVVLVLLICCATLANLLLVRASGRHQELAIRCSLGASRAGIARQLIIESLILSFGGGVVSLALAAWLPQVIVSLAPVDLPQINVVTLNGHVLAFALLAVFLTGLLSGLIPALQATRIDLVTNLKDGSRGAGTAAATQRLHAWFAGGQVALSLILLVGSGLLLKSFWNALRIDPGFDTRGVVTAGMWLPPPTDPNALQTYRSHANRTTLMREMLRRIQTLPGVQDAAIGTGSCLPLSGNLRNATLTIEGTTSSTGAAPRALLSTVTPDYFHTLGIRLLQGRFFTETDQDDTRVALVNRAAAARFWGGQNPVGRRLALGTRDNPQWWSIVGIVDNVKTGGLDVPDEPHIYLPAYQQSGLGLTVFLRTSGRAGSWEEYLCREVQAIDPDLPVFSVRSLEDVMAGSLTQRRFTVLLTGAFAAVAFLLAGLGIYGVVALTVSHRTQEMGVRLALGAQPYQLAGLVLRRGLVITACGIGVGLVAAVVLVRLIKDMLFATNPWDLFTFSSVMVLLTAVSLLACWIPARRAAKVDPMEALRCE